MTGPYEWLIAVVGIFWMFAPWLLTGLGWWQWYRTGRPRSAAFLAGILLTTVSCGAVIPFMIPATARWEQIRVYVLEAGIVVSAVFSVIALLVLPRAREKAKWFPFISSLMNVFLAIVFLTGLSD